MHEHVLERTVAAHRSERALQPDRASAMIATWLQSRSTTAMTWLEKTTVPPPATYRCRMSRISAADTGSTASNGSSSTRRRGACSSAQASPIFFFMPAE
jgi:hypothetical protein